MPSRENLEEKYKWLFIEISKQLPAIEFQFGVTNHGWDYAIAGKFLDKRVSKEKDAVFLGLVEFFKGKLLNDSK